ncbi:MAG: ATP-binding protein [Eudoraea sp.]|nr:ATP-binding protein [Eudoraea sp.]
MEEAYKQKPTDLVKVVLFGPESTGKTTLAQELATHYKTSWVPEYAREYLQNKWDRDKRICELPDLLPIARGQIRIENSLSAVAEQVLICDTDLLETKVYSEIYFDGYCDPILERFALENTYDLYLLTNIDIPWEKDDLRDKPFEREAIFEKFKATLEEYGRNFVILKGDRNQRLNQAILKINQYLNRS